MLEINQYIEKTHLPDGGCTIDNETFAPLNLPEKAGWKVYYDLLLKEQEKQQNGNGSGQDGSNGMSRIEKLMAGQSGEEAKTDDGDLIPHHGSWSEFDDLSDAEKKLMKAQVEHMLEGIAEQIEKTHGTIPGEFSEIINKIKHKEPPKFDWKSYLRRFAGGSQIVFTKKMRRKFNKRFEDNPGLKIKQRRHVLVAIDTSGSVSSKELQEFFNEIDHINKTGSDITVIQCDSSIKSIKPYKKGDDIEVQGRGGTSFDPVLEYYNENLRKYSCMLYLTDGECYTNVKVRGKMLWVISTRGKINKGLMGPQIKLN
jgi:predicted metal-dependent peptidase